MKGYQIALIAVIVIILIVGGGIGIYYATKEETIPQFVTDAQNRLEDEESAQSRFEDEENAQIAAAASPAANASKPATTTAANASKPTSFSGTARSPAVTTAAAIAEANLALEQKSAGSPVVVSSLTPEMGTAGKPAVITTANAMADAIAKTNQRLSRILPGSPVVVSSPEMGTAGKPAVITTANAMADAIAETNQRLSRILPGSPVVVSNPTPEMGTARSPAVITDAEVAAARLALDQETAAKEAAKLAEIDAALAEVYGISSATRCPTAPCMDGTIDMTAGQCTLMGGAVKGIVASNVKTPCYVKIGKNASRAFFPVNTCPSSKCHYGRIQTTGAACRAIGGTTTGTPGDAEWTSCYIGIGPASLAGTKYGLFPSGKCPFGTCYPVRINAQGNSCRALGGSSTASGTNLGPCEMNLGRTART